jgi:hypothetical protein
MGHESQHHEEENETRQTFHQRSTSETSVRNAVFSIDMAVGMGGLKY